jgi:hypothetical protein
VPPEEKLLAGLTIALAVGLELVEPDDLLPVGLPADDIARRAVVKQARRALQEGGIEGFVRSVKNQLGDSADNILRELGLGEYVDDVAQKGDNLVNDAVGAICSFSADTLVSTPYGFAAISELAEGQYVLAYDEATGELIYAPILATWVHEDPLIVHLTIDGELIQTTPEHPFRLANGDWVPAAALEIGSQIQRANGTTGIVQAIDFNYDSQLMYNLTVAAAHTFFVGEGQWLVHNDCGKWIKVNESMSPRAAAYQSRITGRSIDEAYSLGGVKFDGFTNGTLVDAKGPGYSQFIENGQFAAWYRGKDELLDQANRQIKAAEGRHPIVWHVAESDAFIVIRDLLQSKGFNAITVKHTP